MLSLRSSLILLIILIFPFGQMTKLPLPYAGVNLYAHDLLIFALVLSEFKKISTYFKSNRYLIGFISFSLFSLFLALNSLKLTEILIGSLYLWRWIFYTLFLFILVEESKLFLKKRITQYLYISVVLGLIFGIVQYFIFPNLEPLFDAGWDRHSYRLVGTWLDANFTGLLITLFSLWALDHLFKNKQSLLEIFNRQKQNPAFFLLSVFSIICLLLTYSRASYLAFIIGIIILSFRKRIFILSIVICIGLIFSLSFLPRKHGEGTKLERTSTVIARLGDWNNDIKVIAQEPAFGYGFNTLRYVKHNLGLINEKWEITHSGAGMDNSLLFLIATVGIFGVIQFLLFWKNVFVSYGLSDVMIASLIAVFVHGMFNNSWLYPWSLIWIYLIIAEKKFNGSS